MSIDKFTQDGQDPKIVEKIYNKIADMLTHQERVNYIALQKKPAVTLLPDSVTISNKRIFLCEFTKLGLATNFEIFDWNDIKDIAFKEEIFGSKVTVIPFTGENLSIDYIPKTQARRLYQMIKDILEEIKSSDHSNDLISNNVKETLVKEEIKAPVTSPPVESNDSIAQVQKDNVDIYSSKPSYDLPCHRESCGHRSWWYRRYGSVPAAAATLRIAGRRVRWSRWSRWPIAGPGHACAAGCRWTAAGHLQRSAPGRYRRWRCGWQRSGR